MKKMVYILSLTILSLKAYAWENCGLINGEPSNCQWQVDSNGVLTIRPQENNNPATIPDYERQAVSPTDERNYIITSPWYNQREQITSIKVEDGIEHIGNHAFMELRWATSASMADSVISLAEDTFTLATRLNDIQLSNNLKSLGGWNFQQTYALNSITLPDSLEEIGVGIFYGHPTITSITLPSNIDFSKTSDGILENSNISTIFCFKDQEKACANFVSRIKKTDYAPSNLSYALYEKYGNGYISGGKLYNRLGDIGTQNYIKKRIYTVEEANRIAGDKNRVSITYK